MFSLIESIVALGFLGLAVTGFLAAANFGLRGIAQARSDDLSASVARNVLDDVRATLVYDSAAGVTAGTRSFTVVEPSAGGASVTYAVTVDVTPDTSGSAEIVVNASGPNGRSARMSEHLTYVAPPPGGVVGTPAPVHAESGFALIEVLVSSAIFLVVLTGALALVRGVDAALVRQLDIESQGADLDRQLAAWRGDAATADAVFAPSSNEVDFFALNNAGDGGASGRSGWQMTLPGVAWRYVYDPSAGTVRRYDYDASGLMGVRSSESGAIDPSASYPPLSGVTGFSVRTISAASLGGAENPYAAAVAGMPTRTHAVDLGNGMTGGNQVTEITIATAQGARRVHLLPGTMPSGFTLRGTASYKAIVYRLDLTHRFLIGLAGKTHVEIRGVVYVSYDRWRTRAPWCDYGIYLDRDQNYSANDPYEQPLHMAQVCERFDAPLPQAGAGGALPSNLTAWQAPSGFFDGGAGRM